MFQGSTRRSETPTMKTSKRKVNHNRGSATKHRKEDAEAENSNSV